MRWIVATILPIENSRILASRMPDSELVILKNMEHGICVEAGAGGSRNGSARSRLGQSDVGMPAEEGTNLVRQKDPNNRI